MTATLRNIFRDPIKKLLFELGAGYYSRKLATGPEADIRREFVQSLQLPPSGNGHGTLRVLDVGCGPGHVARELAQSGHDVLTTLNWYVHDNAESKLETPFASQTTASPSMVADVTGSARRASAIAGTWKPRDRRTSPLGKRPE